GARSRTRLGRAEPPRGHQGGCRGGGSRRRRGHRREGTRDRTGVRRSNRPVRRSGGRARGTGTALAGGEHVRPRTILDVARATRGRVLWRGVLPDPEAGAAPITGAA